MKKWISWILAACLLLSLTACGEQAEETPSFEVMQPGVKESEPVTVTNGETQNTSEKDREHILIAYFSWADNTVVEDEDSAVQSALSHYDSIGDSENYSDVDAVASASVVAPGNTARLAQWIQEYVGGDLFPIVVAEPYPDDYDECLERAADEEAENARPELENHLDSISNYDVIFLGFPNWWASIPMPIASFLEEYDFTGKTIIPFCSHGGGRFGQSLTAIAKLVPDATMGEALSVHYSDGDSLPDDIMKWLKSNGILE